MWILNRRRLLVDTGLSLGLGVYEILVSDTLKKVGKPRAWASIIITSLMIALNGKGFDILAPLLFTLLSCDCLKKVILQSNFCRPI
jgi:hypothetical protein